MQAGLIKVGLMDTKVKFLDCPEYLDNQCLLKCGLPAEVLCRRNVDSTRRAAREKRRSGVPRGHWFNGPVESPRWGKPGSAIWDAKGVQDHDVSGLTLDRGKIV
jgi:hypothetical protein